MNPGTTSRRRLDGSIVFVALAARRADWLDQMRSFIAIDFDDAVRKQLAVAQDGLKQGCPHLRWADPRKIHLTLKFLGEIGDSQIEPVGAALDELAAQCSQFDFAVEGIGVFGSPGSVRVVWVGIREINSELTRCRERCERFMAPLGFPEETRPFHPHLTLARNRSPGHSQAIRRAVEAMRDFRAGSQTVSSITFYESTLTGQGPVYHVLSRHPFGDV